MVVLSEVIVSACCSLDTHRTHLWSRCFGEMNTFRYEECDSSSNGSSLTVESSNEDVILIHVVKKSLHLIAYPITVPLKDCQWGCSCIIVYC